MKVIHQRVRFATSPKDLFDTYLDSKKHGAAIDDTASISRKVGGAFSAFGGMLRGKNLLLVRDRLIVQSWRGRSWKKQDLDSILILRFSKIQGGAQLDLVQVGVPDYESKAIQRGWVTYYWTPWKAYLKRRKK